MKIKLKSTETLLPNCWKSCGVSHEEWQSLQSGKAIEVNNVAESIENLVTIIKSKGAK
tara:strand:+ start:173 stop:346 length:174 start_codon:yes stop_codon:yes gene_type:complete